MGQGDSAEDFDPSESMENVGILDVFPIFHNLPVICQHKVRDPPLEGGGLGVIELTIDNVNQELKYEKRWDHRNVCHPERSAQREV